MTNEQALRGKLLSEHLIKYELLRIAEMMGEKIGGGII